MQVSLHYHLHAVLQLPPLPSGPFPLFRTNLLLVLTPTLVSGGTRWRSQGSGSSAVRMPWSSPLLQPHSQAMLQSAFQFLLCISRRLVPPTDPGWEPWSCRVRLQQFPLLSPWLGLRDCRFSQSWDTSLSGTSIPLCFFSFPDPNEGSILSCPSPPLFLSLCSPLHSCHQGQVCQQTPLMGAQILPIFSWASSSKKHFQLKNKTLTISEHSPLKH